MTDNTSTATPPHQHYEGGPVFGGRTCTSSGCHEAVRLGLVVNASEHNDWCWKVADCEGCSARAGERCNDDCDDGGDVECLCEAAR